MTGSRGHRRKVAAITVAMGLIVSVAGAQSIRASEVGDGKKIQYMNVGRTFGVTIQESQWIEEPIVPLQPTLTQRAYVAQFEGLITVLSDCTDQLLVCVRTEFDTYAVPRSGLRAGNVYAKDGIRFRVEKCLRGDSERCQVALISSTCGTSGNADICPLPSDSSAVRPRVRHAVYFVFNEDVGISAFGTASRPVRGLRRQLEVVAQLVLVSSRGLLCCALSNR
jgi:hypothetical protein